MDNSGGGGRLNRNNEFVATNLSTKTPNFCSKNSPQNQTISNAKAYKNLVKNRYFNNLYYINFDNILLRKQSFLNVKSYKNLIESRYFSNFKNINFYNHILKNQVKNIANTHFNNLTNINFNCKTIKSYYKNFHYNLIKRRHTISGLFPVSCRRLNTKLNYNQYNLSKIPKQNTLIKSFLPRLQE